MPEYEANTPLTIETDVVVQTQTVEFDIIPDDIVLTEVAVGIPGDKGDTGATGIVKVTHNADPNVARPVATIVYWVGTVQPLNAAPDDLLMLKG